MCEMFRSFVSMCEMFRCFVAMCEMFRCFACLKVWDVSSFVVCVSFFQLKFFFRNSTLTFERKGILCKKRHPL